MIIVKEETRCSNCHSIVMVGQAMLEGPGGTLLCDGDCFDEVMDEIEGTDPDEEDDEDG
jgi:hypothetical protein